MCKCKYANVLIEDGVKEAHFYFYQIIMDVLILPNKKPFKTETA
jgi:hypothetical protein